MQFVLLSIQFIYEFPIPAPSECFPIFTKVILTNILLSSKVQMGKNSQNLIPVAYSPNVLLTTENIGLQTKIPGI